jgi:hypothetical protein
MLLHVYIIGWAKVNISRLLAAEMQFLRCVEGKTKREKINEKISI